jgi:hypothetical protein
VIADREKYVDEGYRKVGHDKNAKQYAEEVKRAQNLAGKR